MIRTHQSHGPPKQYPPAAIREGPLQGGSDWATVMIDKVAVVKSYKGTYSSDTPAKGNVYTQARVTYTALTNGVEYAAINDADNYYVVATNEAGDIVAIEREVYDDSFGGSGFWDAIAPWVDEGDYLAYQETWDDSTYRILFDGVGGYVTQPGRRRPGRPVPPTRSEM